MRFTLLTPVVFAACLNYERSVPKIMKPKPPVPPVKTKPSTVLSSLPHTQLVCIQTADRANRTFQPSTFAAIAIQTFLNPSKGIHVYKDICGFWHVPKIAVS